VRRLAVEGLVPPDGEAPTIALRARFGGTAWPASWPFARAGDGPIRRWTRRGGLRRGLAEGLASIFTRAGVVCELSNDPIGVELAGVAKERGGARRRRDRGSGLNAAGAAAGHIFAEVWRFAEAAGARPESFIGLAGAATSSPRAAPMSRNRRAGSCSRRVSPAEIQVRVAQAVEALESVPLLAQAIEHAGLAAPVTAGSHV